MIKVNMAHVKLEGMGVVLIAEIGTAVHSVAKLIIEHGAEGSGIKMLKEIVNDAIDNACEDVQEEPEIKNVKLDLIKELLKSLFEGKQDDEPCDGWKFNVKEADDGAFDDPEGQG